jgi:hypothetical protein
VVKKLGLVEINFFLRKGWKDVKEALRVAKAELKARLN